MMATKVCAFCHRRKPIGRFYRLHKGEARRQRLCKTCDNRRRVRAQVVVLTRREFLRDPVAAIRKARVRPVHIVDAHQNLRAVLSCPNARIVK